MDAFVRPKKSLGQHFLKDENIARKIVASLSPGLVNILEIGPGMGILTGHLLDLPDKIVYFIDTDKESIEYLCDRFPEHREKMIRGDFLDYQLEGLFQDEFAIIGNFPYNISSQIFFKVLDYRQQVTEVVGMVQKEVAERLASGPGSKKYGILSVLLQAFYSIEYLFTVNETVFIPPPRVKSAVIRLKRNTRQNLECDEKLFFQIVKTAFNQRRKTLRNSLKPVGIIIRSPEFEYYASKRAEQLSVEDFERLAILIEKERAV